MSFAWGNCTNHFLKRMKAWPHPTSTHGRWLQCVYYFRMPTKCGLAIRAEICSRLQKEWSCQDLKLCWPDCIQHTELKHHTVHKAEPSIRFGFWEQTRGGAILDVGKEGERAATNKSECPVLFPLRRLSFSHLSFNISPSRTPSSLLTTSNWLTQIPYNFFLQAV